MAKYGGAWPTMVTPFCADGEIDWPAYRDMVAWYVEHGVGGVYANCLSSEMECLSDGERVRLAEVAVEVAAGRVPVTATGDLGYAEAQHLELCRRMAGAGVDAVMLVVPSFLDGDDALLGYYLRLAQRVDAPLGLYECPVPRRVQLSLNLVAQLAPTGRFVAFKKTSEDIDKIRAVQRLTADTPLSLLQACNAYVLEAARLGVLGTMSIAAIHLPDLLREIIVKGRAATQMPRGCKACCAPCIWRSAPCTRRAASTYSARRGLRIGLRCRRPGCDLTPKLCAPSTMPPVIGSPRRDAFAACRPGGTAPR